MHSGKQDESPSLSTVTHAFAVRWALRPSEWFPRQSAAELQSFVQNPSPPHKSDAQSSST
jgi:hypothetical protein